ncbi:MAG: dihydroorotase, partial [Candidatus Saganbacteria bacterium]|nr:dihydroorotase [Candidatus Saganbacteria bacterium]
MEKESFLIRSGRVIDPAQGLDAEADVLVEDGKIKSISKSITSRTAKVISAKGKIVLPGLIDMHTHLRDPGRPDEEDIASGTRAAAKGGFTSVLCMPNTDPAIDNDAIVRYVIAKAQSEGIVNVFPAGAVTKGRRGEELSEMGLMLLAGAVAFSDDGSPIMNAGVMRRALEYLRQFDAPLISHPEDKNLSSGGAMNESYVSTIMGLPPIPALAEEIMVERDIKLAREFGRVHIAHVSTARSVELIRRAKEEGIKVTAETAPHYFTLTENEVEGYNTNAKMNPPLRGEKDVAEIIKGLKDGTIDCIATDHAPHTVEE